MRGFYKSPCGRSHFSSFNKIEPSYHLANKPKTRALSILTEFGKKKEVKVNQGLWLVSSLKWGRSGKIPFGMRIQ